MKSKKIYNSVVGVIEKNFCVRKENDGTMER